VQGQAVDGDAENKEPYSPKTCATTLTCRPPRRIKTRAHACIRGAGEADEGM